MELSTFEKKSPTSSLSQRSSSPGLERQRQDTGVVFGHGSDDDGDDVLEANGTGYDDDQNDEDCNNNDNGNDNDNDVEGLEGRSLIPTFPLRRQSAPLAVIRHLFSTGRPSRIGADAIDGTTTNSAWSPSPTRRRRQCVDLLHNVLHRHWLGGDDDGPWTFPPTGTILLDSASVKAFKFFLVSAVALLAVHAYVRAVGDKRDVTYGIREMILYDGGHISLDLLVFFVVGRLHRQAAVDTLAWVGPAFGSAALQSAVATRVHALQHSITPYEVRCSWPWQMWTLLGLGGVPFFGAVFASHVAGAAGRGVAAQKLVELLAGLAVFVGPPLALGGSLFHLHHWYYGWLFGMHCNLNVWWSRLTMAVLFGVYLNGIAIFGRDPIMTCAVTLYQSQNQQCPYLAQVAVTTDGGGSDGDNVLTHGYTMDDLVRDSGTAADWHNDGGCGATNAPAARA